MDGRSLEILSSEMEDLREDTWSEVSSGSSGIWQIQVVGRSESRNLFIAVCNKWYSIGSSSIAAALEPDRDYRNS